MKKITEKIDDIDNKKLLLEIEEALIKTKEVQDLLCTMRDKQHDKTLIQAKIDGLSDVILALHHAYDKLRSKKIY